MTTYQVDGWTALGDPRRREIFERLVERPRTVAELTGELPISQPAISQHLKVLREADLVGFRPDGARRVYRVKPEGIAALRADLDRFWASTLANFKQLADAEAAQRKDNDHD
ncbi:winged helix-turn-helix transcriptional regulator [Microlunatus elymi]|uniref:Winged helix-turn-helix transcriptional regulator n=1 Tax=Microlunatus elymi TaxID=2596828 RepID=A0A516Q2E3_9ACTN|nr:metalloregulator ArsR/SmtB family transcription factor [Microlunatus elymi]QDP97607.1 winged helix-turn-helix transcriptional regulator [Microlunatus elymi]